MVLAQERRRPSRIFLEEQDWSKLWKLRLQDRLKLLLWKIASDAIPVRVPSFRRGEAEHNSNLLCICCGQRPATSLHLFHECTVARLLWNTSMRSLDISRISISSPAKWIHILLNADTLLGIRSRSYPSFILNAAFDYGYFVVLPEQGLP